MKTKELKRLLKKYDDEKIDERCAEIDEWVGMSVIHFW